MTNFPDPTVVVHWFPVKRFMLCLSAAATDEHADVLDRQVASECLECVIHAFKVGGVDMAVFSIVRERSELDDSRGMDSSCEADESKRGRGGILESLGDSTVID